MHHFKAADLHMLKPNEQLILVKLCSVEKSIITDLLIQFRTLTK